jgi:hypothetical protein
MAYKTDTIRTKAYLEQSIKDIDSIFGEGYAKKNPELLSAYLKCNIDDEIAVQYDRSFEFFSGVFQDFENDISLIEQRLHSISKSFEKFVDKDD